MTGHQIVWMRPAGQPANPREPIAQMRIIVPVDADLIIEKEIADERQIGDRESLGHDEATAVEMRIQYAPCGFRTLAKFLHDGPIRLGHERSQKSIRRGVTRQLVIIVEEPSQ